MLSVDFAQGAGEMYLVKSVSLAQLLITDQMIHCRR